MEILGIGMPELIFILIIALIVLGPKDMQKAGRTVGRFMRNVVTSEGWKAFLQTSREIRTLPNRLMREANDEIYKIGKEINAADPIHSRSSSSVPSRPPASPAKTVKPAVLPPEENKPQPSIKESGSPTDDQEKNA